MRDHAAVRRLMARPLTACMLLAGLLAAAVAPGAAGAQAAAPAAPAGALRYAPPSHAGEPLNERFRGVNWERNGDNFTTGDLLQDGLIPSASYSYDDTSPAIVYAGSWTHAANQSFTATDYDNTESYSGTAGDTATLTFTGTAIRWIGSQTSNHGLADVYLDGVFQATVDTSGNAYQKVLFQRSGLPSGTHTIQIVVDGQHSSGSTASYVSIDAFDLHVPGLVSYLSVYQRATQILSSLQANLHINTVRLGVNEQTTQDAWWTNYGAVVQAATDLGMNVVIGFWSPSNGTPGSVVPCADGTFTGCYPIPDYTPWWAMWNTIIRSYASYGNVYLMPFNEAAGYSDTATGFEGPSATQLADLDAAWLAHYPQFPRGRVILGGTGDDYYLTLGHDPRLDGTLLSYHPYCSFGLSFPTEAAWTQWIKGQIAGMESRTVITEFGLQQAGPNFDGPRDGNSCVSYVYAVTDYARAHHLGLIYWDYGSTDTWSVATRTGSGTAADPFVTHIANQSFVDRLEWGYGLSTPVSATVSSAAATTFYTGAATNRFTVRTTADPVASLAAAGPGSGGALPAGVTFTDNHNGTGTLSGTAAALVPGTYPVTITAANSVGSSAQTLTLTVTAGARPAPATGTIAGTITDASGHPLAGVCAHVFVASSLVNYTGNNYAPAVYQACSTSTGRYSIPLVTPGSARYDVQFIDSDARYLPQWHDAADGPTTSARDGYNHPGTPVTVTAAATTTVDATMTPIPSGITVRLPAKPPATASPRSPWLVTGTITVTNNNNVALTGVRVTDSVNDPDARCAVSGANGVTISASPLYPAPLVTATFSYTCRYTRRPASAHETDTATVTWAASPHIPGTTLQYHQRFTT